MEMYWREGVLGIRGAGGGNGEDEGGRGGFVEGLRTGEVMKMLGWESWIGGGFNWKCDFCLSIKSLRGECRGMRRLSSKGTIRETHHNIRY